MTVARFDMHNPALIPCIVDERVPLLLILYPSQISNRNVSATAATNNVDDMIATRAITDWTQMTIVQRCLRITLPYMIVYGLVALSGVVCTVYCCLKVPCHA